MLKPFQNQSKRGQLEACQVCQKKFKLTNKEHLCKRCMASVCSGCGPARYPVYDINLKKQDHRVCIPCKNQIERMQNLKIEQRIGFCENASTIQSIINKHLGITPDQRLKRYLDLLAKSNEQVSKFRSYLSKIKDQLLPSLTYSFRQFLCLALGEKQMNVIVEPLKNVIIALLNQVNNLDFDPRLIHLVLFVLCLASQVNSFWILQRIFKALSPNLLNSGIIKSKDFLVPKMIMMVEQAIQPAKVQKQAIQRRVEQFLPQFTSSLSANQVSPQASFLIVTQLFSRVSANDFAKFVAASISLVKQDLKREDVRVMLLKKVTKTSLRGRTGKIRELLPEIILKQEVKADVPQEKKVNLFLKDNLLQKNKQIGSLKDEVNDLKKQVELLRSQQAQSNALLNQLRKENQRAKLEASNSSQELVRYLQEKLAKAKEQSGKQQQQVKQTVKLMDQFKSVMSQCQDPITLQFYQCLQNTLRQGEASNSFKVEADQSLIYKRNYQLSQKLDHAITMLQQKQALLKRSSKRVQQLQKNEQALNSRIESILKENQRLKERLSKFQNYEFKEQNLFEMGELNEVHQQILKIPDMASRYTLQQFFKKNRILSDQIKCTKVQTWIRRQRMMLLQQQIDSLKIQNEKLKGKLLADVRMKMQESDSRAELINQQLLSKLSGQQPTAQQGCKQF